MLAVADGGASIIILFDSLGHERTRLGSKGRGPGEFTGALSLAGGSGDSLLVWDPGQTRWSVISGTPATIQTSAANNGPAAWMHAGVLVRGEGDLVPAWAPPLLQRLADSLGLERVVVHALTRPSGIAPDRMPAESLAPEMFYAGAGRYTTRSDSLTVQMPEGTRFRVLDANDRGWRGVGWVTATGYACGMIVGGTPPRDVIAKPAMIQRGAERSAALSESKCRIALSESAPLSHAGVNVAANGRMVSPIDLSGANTSSAMNPTCVHGSRCRKTVLPSE